MTDKVNHRGVIAHRLKIPNLTGLAQLGETPVLSYQTCLMSIIGAAADDVCQYLAPGYLLHQLEEEEPKTKMSPPFLP